MRDPLGGGRQKRRGSPRHNTFAAAAGADQQRSRKQQPPCLLSPRTGINLTFKKGSLISTARCIAGDPDRRIKFCSMLDSQFDKMYRDGKIPTRRPGGERMWNMDETQIADGAHGPFPHARTRASPAVPNGDSETDSC